MVRENILGQFVDFSWHCNDQCKIYADTLKVVSWGERKHAPWIKIIDLSKGHCMSGMFKQGTSSFELFSCFFPWPCPVFDDLKFSGYNFRKLSLLFRVVFEITQFNSHNQNMSTKICAIHGDKDTVRWKLRSLAMNLTVSLCSWQSKCELWNRVVNFTPNFIAWEFAKFFATEVHAIRYTAVTVASFWEFF